MEDEAMATIDDDRMSKLVEEAIQKQQNKYREASYGLRKWHCPSLTKFNFWRLIKANAEATMARRGVFRSYEIDDFNREILNQMFLYVIGSEDCKWNIDKGIYLAGKVGCGKTLLLQSLCEVLHLVSDHTIEMISAPELCRRIAEKGFDRFATRPLFIDELGRESLEINAFGIKIHPIKELMSNRYNNGARTFFTSNYKLSTSSKWRNERVNS
jgi:DNA replication protein DnaC